MNVRTKKQETNHITFDQRLRAAIFRPGLPYTRQVELYNEILDICRVQVYDCVDVMQCCIYLALNERHHFGQGRINDLEKDIQPILDEAIERYDIGAMYKLRNELASRGIKYTLHVERGKK